MADDKKADHEKSKEIQGRLLDELDDHLREGILSIEAEIEEMRKWSSGEQSEYSASAASNFAREELKFLPKILPIYEELLSALPPPYPGEWEQLLDMMRQRRDVIKSIRWRDHFRSSRGNVDYYKSQRERIDAPTPGGAFWNKSYYLDRTLCTLVRDLRRLGKDSQWLPAENFSGIRQELEDELLPFFAKQEEYRKQSLGANFLADFLNRHAPAGIEIKALLPWDLPPWEYSILPLMKVDGTHFIYSLQEKHHRRHSLIHLGGRDFKVAAAFFTDRNSYRLCHENAKIHIVGLSQIL